MTGHDWITGALDRFGKLLPDGYPAYARILHPAEERVGAEWRQVGWTEIAARTGGTIHPLVQFHRLTRGEWEGQAPWPGQLADDQLDALIPLLAQATTTPGACSFCVWEGYGEVTGAVQFLTASSSGIPPTPPAGPLPPAGLDRLPRLHLPNRGYLVLRGAVDDARGVGVDFLPAPFGSRLGPNLWWPDDRAWVVASEIDLDSTYVAGPRTLIDAILAAPALEALESEAGAPITLDSDTLNG